MRQRLNSRGVSYGRQLRVELNGEFSVLQEDAEVAHQKIDAGEEPTPVEWRHCFHFDELCSAWRRLNGDCPPEKFFAFFRSPHYFAVPRVSISAMLVAKILTGQKRIEASDVMDVEHLSLMLPYADVMVVDRAMKGIVRQLKLDRAYGTKVLYLGDRDQIAQFFLSVRSGFQRLEAE